MAPDVNDNGLPDAVDKFVSGALLTAQTALAAAMTATAKTHDWEWWVYAIMAALPVVAGFFAIKGR